jgi:hypothetical protein
MQKMKLWATFAALVLLVWSCDDTEEPVVTAKPYESGVFITHEGAFTGGTGTVSFYNRSVGGIKNDVFGAENSGAAIGNILQSLSVANGKAYLLVNNANKIMIADAKTFKYQDSIGGLSLPRYFLAIDDKKAYVSEWGKNGTEGAVKVLDLTTKKFTKTIPTGKGAERLLKVGNNVWAVNVGGYSSDSTVAIIDISTESISKKITVGVGPNSLVQDSNGDVWVLCGGAFGQKNGKLLQIKNNAVTATYLVPQGASALSTNSAKSVLYFVTSKAVYQKDLTTANPTVLIDKPSANRTFGTLYGMGVDTKNGDLYLADAKNYSSKGTVYVFNSAKSLVDSMQTGIIPGNFWFQ